MQAWRHLPPMVEYDGARSVETYDSRRPSAILCTLVDLGDFACRVVQSINAGVVCMSPGSGSVGRIPDEYSGREFRQLACREIQPCEAERRVLGDGLEVDARAGIPNNGAVVPNRNVAHGRS